MCEENKCPECDNEQIIAELNDKYLRAMAELENTRRRSSIDAQNLVRNRSITLAEKILPLIDAIDAALAQNPEDPGIKSMAIAANGVLTDIGITKIVSIGEQLNPSLHNAISTQQSESEPGTIVGEFQPGYMMGDTVLRTAMVIVSAKS